MNSLFLRPSGCPYGVDPRDWRIAVVERQANSQSALIDALDHPAAGDQVRRNSRGGDDGSRQVGFLAPVLARPTTSPAANLHHPSISISFDKIDYFDLLHLVRRCQALNQTLLDLAV